MVKTKGGRLMNPTDSFRKEQRKKEIQRNKLERKFQREAHRQISAPVDLKHELERVLEAEKDGMLNKTLRLKKKVLQEAYDQSLKRQKEEDARVRKGDNLSSPLPHGHGVPQPRPEDSRYYHPTLNPTGAPPPGKATAFQCPVPISAPGNTVPPSKATLPVPAPPPLPAGPAPARLHGLPPPPAAPPLPTGPALPPTSGGPQTSNSHRSEQPLPAPAMPPPMFDPSGAHSSDADPTGAAPLPPPPGLPPGYTAAPSGRCDSDEEGPPGVGPGPVPAPAGPLPPPPGPPPGYREEGRLPPPPGPPPGPPFPMHMPRMPPPPMPPPVYPLPTGPPLQAAPPTSMPHLMLPPEVPQSAPAGKRDTKSTISAASTVTKRPLAQNDKALTSMVPASVRVRREAAGVQKPATKKPCIAPGYGLAPQMAAPSSALRPPDSSTTSMDQKMMAFFQEVEELGAFEEM
eukprot:evm.model.scf_248EXC.4 EVM.evm.TU.scf_248EXC.4   scf_248EXC:22709-27528(+)